MTINLPSHTAVSRKESETVTLGRELAGFLEPGMLLSLSGPLGAGKTCFIKGIAQGLGIDENEIKSPSFTLVNEYYGRLPLFHFDLYRMTNLTELKEIGWDDYLLRDGIIAVEWGEKASEFLPAERFEIQFRILTETEREIRILFVKR
ncbi:MAG: tRNA (adenosine(37)-N6)-threonylcarbamoyltransferase complex ATPase subunit type 1 TsaE [Candidatus Zixiibacteriota bacterium]|jgi:tRNA threonylcarbamoyladenosine biosynthesis protein TsaE